MIDVKAYFSLNRKILLALGLWPYHQTSFTTFHFLLFSSILTSCIASQLFGLLTVEHKPKLIIKAITHILFFTVCAVKYNSFWVNIQIMKLMMEHLQYICNELKNVHEIAIIKKYGTIGALLTNIFIYGCIFFILAYLCMPCMPYILERILSIHITQSDITSYYVTEYFIDEEKISYLIPVHIYVASIIGMLATAAVGSFLVVYIEYSCGMFKIACYRIDEAITVNKKQKNSFEDPLLIYKKISLAIEMHRNAIRFCEFLIYTMQKPYFFLILIIVSSLSLQYYQIFHTAISGDDISESIMHFGDAIILLIYLLIFNYMGQQVTDHNNYVQLTAYNVQWYKAPLPVQRMMLFVLQRGSREFQLTIAGIFVLSLESCASLMGASLSYFTFMYAVQQ